MSKIGQVLHLPIDEFEIEMEEAAPGYFLGTLNILGTPHHIELVEVSHIGCEGGLEQVPVRYEIDGEECLNPSRYKALRARCDNEPLATVYFDGRTFVCLMVPFSQR